MSSNDPANQGHRASDAILNPVETVRAHPEWFFRGGIFDGEEAAALLTAEALRGGATDVNVLRANEWFIVCAGVDWLDGDVAAFLAPQAYSEGGRNASRVEVALTAFCRAVFTATSEQSFAVLSPERAELPEIVDNLIARGGIGRLVAFLPQVPAAEPREERTRAAFEDLYAGHGRAYELELEAEVARLRAENERLTKGFDAARAAADEWADEVGRYADKHRSLRAERDSAVAEVAKVTARLERAVSAIEKLRDDYACWGAESPMDHALRGATAWEVARRLTEILSDSGEQSSNDS